MSLQQASLNSWLTSGRLCINGEQPTNLSNRGNNLNNDVIINTSNNTNNSPTQRTNRRPKSRHLVQQSINSTDKCPTKFDQPWGHPIPETKSDSAFRIGFRNINSLPIQATDVKNDLIMRDIRQYSFDVFGFSETNLAWQNLPQRDRVYDRFKGKLEFSKFVFANNKDPEYKEQQQSGGQ